MKQVFEAFSFFFVFVIFSRKLVWCGRDDFWKILLAGFSFAMAIQLMVSNCFPALSAAKRSAWDPVVSYRSCK